MTRPSQIYTGWTREDMRHTLKSAGYAPIGFRVPNNSDRLYLEPNGFDSQRRRVWLGLKWHRPGDPIPTEPRLILRERNE